MYVPNYTNKQCRTASAHYKTRRRDKQILSSLTVGNVSTLK